MRMVPRPHVYRGGVPTRRDEYAEETKRDLLRAARRLFTERGYSSSATDQIVTEAGVSRGALYHHFKDKEDLFRAVVEDVNAELSDQMATRAMGNEDLWAGVLEGIDAFLDACLDPAYQRIILLDGPSVLGWEAWRDLAERHGLGIIRAMLEQAMKEEVIAEAPIEPLAYMLHGALNEAGMHIARAQDVARARAEVQPSLIRLIESLRV
jgi:AcrR family transcriptional regulator